MHFGEANGLWLLGATLLIAVVSAIFSRRAGDRKGTRYFWEWCLRFGIIILIGMTVADPYLERERRSSKAVVLVDISDSVDEEIGEKLFEQARSFEEDDVRLEFLPFAQEPSPLALTSDEAGSFRALKRGWSRLNIGATDLEKALQTAALGGAASVVLLSDGFETKGDARRSLPALKTAGLTVFPLLPENAVRGAGGFSVSNLHAPLVAPAKKSVDIRVSVKNSTVQEQRGKLRVYHDSKLVLDKSVSVLAGGEGLFTAPSDPLQEGIKEVRAVLEPDLPELSPSSRTVFISGEGRERVLLLSGRSEDEKYLKEALQDQSYQLESQVADGKRLPDEPELKRYSTVVLNNIALDELPSGMATALDRYLKDGGGMVMIGGNRSFGLGGYKNSTVEDLLPVKLLSPEKTQKRLNVAVELVLDKSASMKVENKLEYTKEAAKAVIKDLKDDDYIGIVAFDQQPFHIVEIGRVGQVRQKAIDRIDLLYGNLTTRLMAAMNLAKKDLERVQAGRKHLILLTDGKVPAATQDGPYYLQLIKEMRLLGITVSTFLVGIEGEPLLKYIAEVGGGAFYRTRDARSLPRLFLKDVKVNTGEQTQKEEGSYHVSPGEKGVESSTLRAFPPVLGYVQTSPKEGADLELVAHANGKADPLLASWRYGQGRAAAFTSDVSGRWSYHWAGWSKFSKFWMEIIDSVRAKGGSAKRRVEFDLRYFVEKGALVLDLSLFSDVGGGVGAKLTRPDGIVETAGFSALSRGHYQARVENVLAGRYELQGSVGDAPLTPVAFFISGELFGEKQGEGFNRPVLEAIADAGGGKVNPEAGDLNRQGAPIKERLELGPWLMLGAMVLLCLEILRREVLRYKRHWWRFRAAP